MTSEDHKRLEAFEDHLVDILHMLFQQPTGETRKNAILCLTHARIAVQAHREHG